MRTKSSRATAPATATATAAGFEPEVIATISARIANRPRTSIAYWWRSATVATPPTVPDSSSTASKRNVSISSEAISRAAPTRQAKGSRRS